MVWTRTGRWGALGGAGGALLDYGALRDFFAERGCDPTDILAERCDLARPTDNTVAP
jgi:hypothetical protein